MKERAKQTGHDGTNVAVASPRAMAVADDGTLFSNAPRPARSVCSLSLRVALGIRGRIDGSSGPSPGFALSSASAAEVRD